MQQCSTSSGAALPAMQHFQRCKRCSGAALQSVQHFKRCSTSSGAALPTVQAVLRFFLIQAVQEVQNARGAKRCRVEFFNTGGVRGAKCKRCNMQEVQSDAEWNFLIQAVQVVLRFFQYRRCRGCRVEFFFEIFRFFEYINFS